MTTNTGNAFKAGVFIVIALALFVFSIFFLGREREIFSSQKDYFTAFKDVKGLSEGAPVRLGGITIGRVGTIAFGSSSEGETAQIQVTMNISEKHLDRIRLDSKVGLETQGLLGDKFVNMTIGRDQRLAPPGSFIPATTEGDIGDIMNKAAKLADNSVQITEDLRSLTNELKGDGTLGQGIKEATEFLKTLNEISKEIKNGSGLLHAMVYDKDGAQTVKAFSELSTNLAQASKEVTQVVQDIKSGNGVIHDLVYNKDNSTQGLSDVIKRLGDTAENLRLASEALKDGSGTLGALLVDAKLYDNLVEVTDGAKRSFILRQAVRSSLNK